MSKFYGLHAEMHLPWIFTGGGLLYCDCYCLLHSFIPVSMDSSSDCSTTITVTASSNTKYNSYNEVFMWLSMPLCNFHGDNKFFCSLLFSVVNVRFLINLTVQLHEIISAHKHQKTPMESFSLCMQIEIHRKCQNIFPLTN